MNGYEIRARLEVMPLDMVSIKKLEASLSKPVNRIAEVKTEILLTAGRRASETNDVLVLAGLFSIVFICGMEAVKEGLATEISKITYPD